MRRTFWLVLMLCGSMQAGAGDDIAQTLTQGQVSFDFRHRLELVDQNGFAQDARASTLRSRLTYTSGDWNGVIGVVEVDNVATIGADKYNSTRNGKTQFPVVADPTGTSLNQAYLQYTGVDDARFRFGRQRIALDNQRFIGPVGWRQNEQTYSGIRADYEGLSDTVLTYAFVNDVSRVFGPDNGTPARSFNSDSSLLNASYTGIDDVTVSGYVYLLDLKNAPTQSSETVGLRLDGRHQHDDMVTISYLLEYAHQSDYASNPNRYSKNYWHGVLGASKSQYSLLLGYESLGGQQGDATQSLQTPLATLHKFQGWADKFLQNPAGGVVDLYVNGSVALGKYKVVLVYHDFEQQDGSLDYGDEWDASIGRTLGDRYNVGLKLARYRAKGFSTDTDKIWLTLHAGF